ncbi:MAG: polysaccharide biosynthesis tyrosine autokinase [Mycobacteriales bacterium]
MDLHAYVTLLRKHVRQIALVFHCAVLVAGYFAFTSPKVYESRIRLFVTTQAQPPDPQGFASASDSYSEALLAVERVKSYSDMITGHRVADEVIKRLNQKDAAGNVIIPRLRASAPTDTVLIDVVASDNDPQRAMETVNMTGDVFVEIVESLERTPGVANAPLRISVYERGQLPYAPVAPRKKLMLIMGGFFGLAAGIGLAIVRDKLDRTLKTAEALSAVAHAPVLGVIGYDSQTPRRPLVVRSHPQSPTAESFRQLRTNIRFVNVDATVRSFVVTSAVSDEGKSTVSCNLALALAQAGQRVILVEADLRKPSVRRYMGVEGAVGLTNVLLGEVGLDDVLQRRNAGHLWVLPGGTIAPNPSELLGSHAMIDVIERLESMADVVIFDTPPLLPVTDAAVLGVNTDGAVLVVRSGHTTHERLERAVESLTAVDVRIIGCVLNMAPTKGPDAYHYYSYYGQKAPNMRQRRQQRLRRVPGDSMPAQRPAQPAVMEAAGPTPVSAHHGRDA